jgi:hypothetical protein
MTEIYQLFERQAYSDGGVTADAVTQMANLYPRSMEIVNSLGETPIHCAMRYCASADVVNAILDAYPAAAMVKENCGLTPLHMGMESGASSEAMESVSKAYPSR